MQLARQGIITEAMLQVAAQEQRRPEVIRAGVAAGTIAFEQYQPLKILCRAVGQGYASASMPISVLPALILILNLSWAISHCALLLMPSVDSVMDLSTGDNIDASRKAIIAASTVMVGIWQHRFIRQTAETIKTRMAVV